MCTEIYSQEPRFAAVNLFQLQDKTSQVKPPFPRSPPDITPANIQSFFLSQKPRCVAFATEQQQFCSAQIQNEYS